MKIESLDMIEPIIKDADGWFPEENDQGKMTIKYWKRVREKGKPFGAVVLELMVDGDTVVAGQDFLRYVTHLPNKGAGFIKNAPSVNPTADGLPQGKSVGATSPGSLNIIGPSDGKVNTPEDEGGESRFRIADQAVDPSSLFEDVEERRKSSKGITTKPLKDRLIEAATKMWHSWSRHFPNLDPNGQGSFINRLRLFETIPDSSKAQAADLVANIIGDMNEAELDVFTMNLVLPDLIKDIDKGILREGEEKGLPFGYKDKAQVEQDLDHYEEEARKSERISLALDKRRHIMERQKNELVDHGLLDKSVLNEEAYYHHQVLEVLAAKDRIGTGTSSGDVLDWQH